MNTVVKKRVFLNFDEKKKKERKKERKKTRNAMYCYNHDDLLQLSFVLKISLFSEASSEPSQASMMKLFLRK